MSAKRSPLWQYFIKDNCRNLQNLFKRCPNKWKRILKSICNAIHPDIYLKYLKSLKSSQAQQKFVESEEESLISSVTECDRVCTEYKYIWKLFNVKKSKRIQILFIVINNCYINWNSLQAASDRWSSTDKKVWK